MGDKSAIGWTEATWNCVTGCDRTSPGCDHCYALIMAARLKLMGSPRYQNDGDPETSGPGFGLTVHPDLLDLPMRWTKPRTIFVNLMSDLFHPDVPLDFILKVWTTMSRCPRHTFQVLTKRPQRMARIASAIAWEWDVCLPGLAGGTAYAWPGRQSDPDGGEDWEPTEADLDGGGEEPLPNVWLGTSIESNTYVWRANHLRNTLAGLRFLSLEPLIGPLPNLNLDGIGWVIVGAESGRGARPMDMDWVRLIRDACVERGIPLYLKQDATARGHKILLPELDGVVWDQMPERSHA
jgi:protein gp37